MLKFICLIVALVASACAADTSRNPSDVPAARVPSGECTYSNGRCTYDLPVIDSDHRASCSSPMLDELAVLDQCQVDTLPLYYGGDALLVEIVVGQDPLPSVQP